MDFADATAATRDPDAPDIYDAAVAAGWDIGGNANGGYLLSIAARAMTQAAGRADPVTLTAHYLSPGKPGALRISTELVKAGKRFATVRALVQGPGDKAVIAVLGTFGDLDPSAAADAPTSVHSPPPELPPIDACVPMRRVALSDEAGPPDFMHNIHLSLHPDDAGFMVGERSGAGRMRGWFSLRDQPIDTIGLLTAVDSFPPTIFNMGLPVGWVPTVELTAHVRARPAPGALRCAFTTRFVTGGFLEEDGEVWDSTGTLVAQSRQLALIPRT
ncbi:MAG: thioesterase family protein [Acidimicrobiales bacterium]